MTTRSDRRVCSKVQRAAYGHATLQRAIPPSVCLDLIREAERHARRSGGWTTDRHAHYPTTDLELRNIPGLWIPVQNLVYRSIIPRMATAFNLNPLKLGISEVFIAKYQAVEGHQRKLEKHQDGSDFSFIVALNDGFSGGGTTFYPAGAASRHVSPRAGDAVAFCSRTQHAGIEVTGGTRYILAGFLYYADSEEGCSAVIDE